MEHFAVPQKAFVLRLEAATVCRRPATMSAAKLHCLATCLHALLGLPCLMSGRRHWFCRGPAPHQAVLPQAPLSYQMKPILLTSSTKPQPPHCLQTEPQELCLLNNSTKSQAPHRLWRNYQLSLLNSRMRPLSGSLGWSVRAPLGALPWSVCPAGLSAMQTVIGATRDPLSRGRSWTSQPPQLLNQLPVTQLAATQP